MANIRLQNINKVYPNGFQAVKDLSLDLADGEFVVLVGPSGCGKSTALRMIAGLEEISNGDLFVGDRRMNDVEPKDRDIAMVFQNYALYPQMTVAENIGFPLRLKRIKKDQRVTQVDDAARILELIDQLQSKPGQLSGGQRQRVAMGRAIVRRPSVFLMDEPLSNLDAKLRVQMRAEISSIQRDLGVTTVYVTHDQIEAMTMGDRVVVMKDGVLQQIDQPEVLYANPVNVFVAAFIGSPSMNLFHANLTTDGTEYALRFADQVVPLDPAVFATKPALHSYVGSEIVVGVRPEDLTEAANTGATQDGQTVHPVLKVVIETREALGAETLMHFRVAAQRVNSGDPDALDELGGNQSTRITARFSPGSRARVGDSVEIKVNTQALHFFDRQTHLAI